MLSVISVYRNTLARLTEKLGCHVTTTSNEKLWQLTWTFFPSPSSRSDSRCPSIPGWRYGTSASASGTRRARSAPWPADLRETAPPNPRSGRSRRSWSSALCWPAASRRGTQPHSDPCFVPTVKSIVLRYPNRLEPYLGASRRILSDSGSIHRLHVSLNDPRHGKSKKAGTRGKAWPQPCFPATCCISNMSSAPTAAVPRTFAFM